MNCLLDFSNVHCLCMFAASDRSLPQTLVTNLSLGKDSQAPHANSSLVKLLSEQLYYMSKTFPCLAMTCLLTLSGCNRIPYHQSVQVFKCTKRPVCLKLRKPSSLIMMYIAITLGPHRVINYSSHYKNFSYIGANKWNDIPPHNVQYQHHFYL